jgi:hypothetical protein
MWQALQTITHYKGKHSRELPSDKRLPDELNNIYARFEAINTETCSNMLLQMTVWSSLSAADVNNTFKQVNIHKAAG